MKNLRNYVQLIGHLGKEPSVTNYDSGKKVARVSLATHDDYFSAKGEKILNTMWHNLVAWDKKADFVEKYFSKGNLVLVNGRLSTRSYEDKSGALKYVTEVIVTDVMKLNKERESDYTPSTFK
ncbi:MAG: single-stranded DNA-binding protein [Saprospiraceae bacterium]|nr:single-stranded DNA-binding protein [Saprospiraceae bacterium]